MAQTNLMRADEIVNAFNGVLERQYWKARIAGTRQNPEVHFNSRSTMVRVSYHVTSDAFSVSFSKTDAAFGDFLASTYKALAQVLASLKASGLPFAAALDDSGELRLTYDPKSKIALVMLARHGDDWGSVEPLSFKVPERNNSETLPNLLDGL